MIEEITQMQMLMSMGRPQLTPQQLTVCALHALNLHHGLTCLDSQGQPCQFPNDWNAQPDGYYNFRYSNTQKTQVQFKISVEGNRVVAVFGDLGSKQTYRVTVNSDEHLDNVVKQYEFTLKQYLGKPSAPPRIQPLFSQPAQNSNNSEGFGSIAVHPVYPPKNLLNPTSVSNPFASQEYVGPDSQIFKGIYQPFQRPLGSTIVPPGARYDPVDPFDGPLLDRGPQTHPDFVLGFDELGRPLGRPGRMMPGPPGSSPFQGGFRGGLGGGFGGGFGGFGGLT